MTRNAVAVLFDGDAELLDRLRETMPLDDGVVHLPHGTVAIHFTPEAHSSALEALGALVGRDVTVDGAHVRIRGVNDDGILASDLNADGQVVSCAYSLGWEAIRTVTVLSD